jgi:hypothetical protein
VVVRNLEVAVDTCVVKVCVVDTEPSLDAVILAYGPGTLPAVVSANVQAELCLTVIALLPVF